MTRFKVVERRVYEETYLIEAENEDAAVRRDGEVIETRGDALNSWAESVVSIEEAEDDEL